MGIVARIKKHFSDQAFLLKMGAKSQVQEAKDGFNKEHTVDEAIKYHGKQLSWHEAALIYFFLRNAGWKIPALVYAGITILCFISYLVTSWKMGKAT